MASGTASQEKVEGGVIITSWLGSVMSTGGEKSSAYIYVISLGIIIVCTSVVFWLFTVIIASGGNSSCSVEIPAMKLIGLSSL